MSELSDREDKFVEDQRRIDFLHNSDKLQFANLQAPQFLMICNAQGQDIVKVNFDGTLEYGDTYRPDEAAQAFWEAISLYAETRDALLAEATEVLRACPMPIEPAWVSWYTTRVEPLLDKLGERE